MIYPNCSNMQTFLLFLEFKYLFAFYTMLYILRTELLLNCHTATPEASERFLSRG